MANRRFVFLMALACLLAPVTSHAQYSPDIIEFHGDDDLGFPSHDSLTIVDGGTIEFWVGADWQDDPGYDPVVLSNAGPEGALYTVSILGDRQGLGLQSGEFLGDVPFDFSDGQMHHVALADFGEDILVMVDGQVVGELATTLPELPSAGLWIGSADGVNAKFRGAIAGLRIWAVALERKTLVDYAQRDVADANAPHPDLELLVAISDFNDESLRLTALEELDDENP
ncbi:MAG: LamG-like jellyroll fold domain-containing protein [Gammaproteobacteria bacterium]